MHTKTTSLTLVMALVGLAWPGHAGGAAATYRGLAPVVKFDVSPPLRDLPPAATTGRLGGHLPDPPTFPWTRLGPQDTDPLVQDSTAHGAAAGIPAPIVSFDGPPNLFLVVPPDPVGDVGPDHYVAMSNLSFAIYDKAGGLLFGPVANNTLWSGFGGDCETGNSGDPIALYDQLADRWLLSQFTSSGPEFFNCVALSTGPDPTGTYYRWAFSTGANFPDYPKYGLWPNAYFISTREFDGLGGPAVGIGAYAASRAQMLAGNPMPQVVSFLLTPAGAGSAFNVGDGLLPADLDGFTPPPADNPHYWVGSMDDGGPYGAPQDALNVWEFHVDFATPANSTFTLNDVLPIAPYDTIFPCSGGPSNCIPQPDTAAQIDILSYQQRPMWRLAYRNFGSHASLVTNQSVEAAAGIAGMRWWEIRVEAGVPALFQEGTYAPGVSDGTHRWMGSIAMDSAGNMALGYSASDGMNTYPSVWYTGRLAVDPPGSMPQGEQSIVDGTGSQTTSFGRWGDYTSTTVDPVDDCTFWHVNEWVPTTSVAGWVLRIGAFRFDECGAPGFSLAVAPADLSVCAGADADYTVTIGSVGGFTDPVTLAAAGNPPPTTAAFDPNPVTPGDTATLTIGDTTLAPAGPNTITVTGTSTAGQRMRDVVLELFTAAPGTVTLLTPADGAVNVSQAPTFLWSAPPAAESYALEIAEDAGFTAIVESASGLGAPSYRPAAPLPVATTLFWRVRAENACGAGPFTAAFSFTTFDATPFKLFAALSDPTLPAYRIDPSSASALAAFTGVAVDGAAYDYEHDRVYFSRGADLWVWPVGAATPTLLGVVTDLEGQTVAMDGLAYLYGTLYAASDGATAGEIEGLHAIDPVSLTGTLVTAFANPSTTLIAGLDADPSTGLLYGVNDDLDLSGLVRIDLDGAVTLITPYPAGETDVDGLAVGGGNAYLITDDANAFWPVYNFESGTYTGAVSSPYTTNEALAAGAWLGPPPPDFLFAVAPVSRHVCAGADTDYTVEVGVLSGFADPVSLSATGNPPPTTATFDPDPVLPPGASTLTIGNTAAAPAGSHTVTVTGTSSTGAKMRDVELVVFTAAPGTITLLAPIAGATGVPPRPDFTWSSVPDAASYRIEVAEDAGFTILVDAANDLPSPSYRPAAALPLAAMLFWRVRAENACGAGAFSAVFSFTTLEATALKLFAGVGDGTQPAYRIEPSTSGALEAFTGVDLNGAAYDHDLDRVLFADGADLWQWPVGAAFPTMLGTITDSLSTPVVMGGLAYFGGLYATRDGSAGEGEGLYAVDPADLTATRVIAYANPSVAIAGIDADPATGLLYGVNNAPTLRGLVRIEPDGVVSLVAQFPVGHNVVNGLAVGGGNAYLITDDAGDEWPVYNLASGTYTGTVTSPYTTVADTGAGGAWIEPASLLFADGFESGNLSRWSATAP